MGFVGKEDDNLHTPRFAPEPSSPERRESVAAVLRRAREKHGQDVRSVAQVLRIRQGYLEALEAGDFDKLPGTAYALGFLRTYAEYLGLNANNIVDRYKEEAEGPERPTELVFPEPVAEARIPGGAIILISVVLLGAAYGGWIYLSNQGRTVADLIPALPNQIQTLIDEQNEAAPGEAPESPVFSAGTPRAPGETQTADASAGGPAAVAPAETDAVVAEAPIDEAPAAESPITESAASETAASETATPVTATPETATSDTPAGETAVAEPPASTVAEREAATPEVAALPAQPPAVQDTESQSPAMAAEEAESPSEPLALTPPSEAPEATAISPGEAAADTVSDAYSSTQASRPDPEPEAEPETDAPTLPELPQAREVGPAPGAAPGTLSTPTQTAALPEAPAEAPEPSEPLVEETVVIPAPPAPGSFAQPGERAPQVYGESNEDSRIVLRAIQDSWVQVRDSQDALLLTRVLRTGDVYRVPDQPGLTLLTGNAGGLEVEVDGVRLPPLGPMGAVRRQIALDPSALLRRSQ